MMGRIRVANVLFVAGGVALLVGAVDPLEGAFVILPGSGLAAAGMFLGNSRYRWLLGLAFVLIAIGVGAMVVLTMLGGIGGRAGHSAWWGVTILPYPVGWIIGLVGSILRCVEWGRSPLRSKSGVR